MTDASNFFNKMSMNKLLENKSKTPVRRQAKTQFIRPKPAAQDD